MNSLPYNLGHSGTKMKINSIKSKLSDNTENYADFRNLRIRYTVKKHNTK